MNEGGIRITPRGLVVGWLICQPGDRGSRAEFMKAHEGRGFTVAQLQQAIEDLRREGKVTQNDGVMVLDADVIFGG